VYAPHDTFLLFTSARELTSAEDESLKSLHAQPADKVLHVFGSDYVLTLGLDVVEPLAPCGWLGCPAINSRFGLLQNYLCTSLQDKATLVLSTYVWSVFNRDCESKHARGKKEHIGLVEQHLDSFSMDKAEIKRVFVPINTGSKTSSGEHWKAVFLQVESSSAHPEGSIWDMDSMKNGSQDRSLYRQFCTDIYTFLRPEGTARLHTTNQLCKHHPYKTALPCVKALGGRPLQDNGYDCGIFMASNVESMALRGRFDFVQADMESLRSQYQLQFALFCGPLSQVKPVRSHLSSMTCIHTFIHTSYPL
jgi:hypothetical protein